MDTLGLITAQPVAPLIQAVRLNGQNVTDRCVTADDRQGYVVLLPRPILKGSWRHKQNVVLYPMWPDGERIRHELHVGTVEIELSPRAKGWQVRHIMSKVVAAGRTAAV